MLKILIPETDMNNFARDQGNCDVTGSLRKIVSVFSWTFNCHFCGCLSKSKGSSGKPHSKHRATFLCTMRDSAGLTKEQFDMSWVSTGVRVPVKGAPSSSLAVLSQIASFTIGATWVLNRERFNSRARGAHVDALKTLLGARDAGRRVPSHETVWTVALLHDQSES